MARRRRKKPYVYTFCTLYIFRVCFLFICLPFNLIVLSILLISCFSRMGGGGGGSSEGVSPGQ